MSIFSVQTLAQHTFYFICIFQQSYQSPENTDQPRLHMKTIQNIVKSICRPPRHIYALERLGNKEFDLLVNEKFALKMGACNGSEEKLSQKINERNSQDISPELKKVSTITPDTLNPQKQIIEKVKRKEPKPESIRVSRHDSIAISKKGHKICYSFFMNSAATIPELYVMFLHSNNGSRIQGLPYTKHILEAKYNVCLMDFSGSGLSEGDKVSLGPNEVGDIEAVALQVRKKYGLRRIVLWGRSMGACAAIMYANTFPERVKCLILDSPFKNLRKLVGELITEKTGMPKIIFQPLLTIVDKELKKETSGFGFEDYKMKKYLQKLEKIPATFILSWDDMLVKPHHGRKLFEKYPCTKKKLLEMSGQHTTVRDDLLIGKCITFINSAIKENYRVLTPCSPTIFKIKDNQAFTFRKPQMIINSQSEQKLSTHQPLNYVMKRNNQNISSYKNKGNDTFINSLEVLNRQSSTISTKFQSHGIEPQDHSNFVNPSQLQKHRNSDGANGMRISLKKKYSIQSNVFQGGNEFSSLASDKEIKRVQKQQKCINLIRSDELLLKNLASEIVEPPVEMKPQTNINPKNQSIFDYSSNNGHEGKIQISKAFQERRKQGKTQLSKQRYRSIEKSQNQFLRTEPIASYLSNNNCKQKQSQLSFQRNPEKEVQSNIGAFEKQKRYSKNESFLFDQRHEKDLSLNNFSQDLSMSKNGSLTKKTGHFLSATTQNSNHIYKTTKKQNLPTVQKLQKQKSFGIKIIEIKHTNNLALANEKFDNKKIKFSK